MSKPWVYAENSARKYGGSPEDYFKIHQWFDETKSACSDIRHRIILHNSWGPHLAEQVFGPAIQIMIEMDAGPSVKWVPVRQIAEDHIIENLGFIPTISEWLNEMPLLRWMTGSRHNKKFSEEQHHMIVK